MKKTKTKDQSLTILKRAFEALQFNQINAMKALKLKANVINQPIPKSISGKPKDYKMTLLHHALEMKTISLEMIKVLLQAGADVNQESDGETVFSIAEHYGVPVAIIEYIVTHSELTIETIIHGISCAIINNNLNLLDLLLTKLEKLGVNIPEILTRNATVNGSLVLTSAKAKRFEMLRKFLKYFKTQQNDNNESPQHKISQDTEVLVCTLGNMEGREDVLDMFKELIEAGADVNQFSATINAYPLDIAAGKHSIDVVKAILEVDPKARQYSALRCALEKKDREMVRLLLEAGASVNEKIYDECTNFLYACHVGDLENVRLLLPYMDKKDINFYCYFAVQRDYRDIVDLLLQNGADANAIIDVPKGEGIIDKHKMLHPAVHHTYLEMIMLLFKHKSTVKDDPYPLCNAAENDSLEVVKLLLDEGADTNLPFDNTTPLENASAAGKYEIAQELIQHGADITNQAVYSAAANGHFDLLYLFAEQRVDFTHTQSTQNESPLHAAVRGNHILAATALIQNGAITDAPSNDELKSTPMHIACMDGRIECVELLLEAGVDINQPNAENLCSLHIAVMNNQLTVLECLLTSEKVDLYPLKEISTAPIALAASLGHTEGFDLIYKKTKSTNQLPDTETWIDCFTGLLPVNQNESKKKFGILLRLLNDLNSQELITIFTAEGPDAPLQKLGQFNDENKVFFQQYLRFFLNHCKSKSIFFPLESKERLTQIASHLGLLSEMNKLFVEPDNLNENNHTSVIKPSVAHKAHIPFSQMMGIFHQMQNQDIERVRKTKKVKQVEPALANLSFANTTKQIKPAYTWGNGLIDSEAKNDKSEFYVKIADSSTNQYFYCPANIITLLEKENVLSVFSAVMDYPKIARAKKQPGLKQLDVDMLPFDVNIIDPETNKVIQCKGKISFEVKTLHAQFSANRLICVSIAADSGKGSLIVPVRYLEAGLHGNDDIKSFTEKLKNIKSFDIIAPHQIAEQKNTLRF